MTDRQPGPVILRIKLGVMLRRLREARGITAQQAAAAIRGSDSKISRIELGRHAAREIDVADLLDLYGVTDLADRDDILAKASQAMESPWWHRYSGAMPAWFQAYLGLEEAADSVLSYDTHFVPGLLQTDDYARGLLLAGGLGEAERADLAAMHSERIARFAAGGWRLTSVIDEAVLRRPVAGTPVLASQLRRLREATAWPGVSIQVRPFTAGPPVTPSGFTLLQFADPDLPDTVYAEMLTGACYLDRPAEVGRYAAALELLRASSHPADETARLLDAAREQLEASGR
jgi:transcriptional regulator with XRE-family HTH domain